MPILEGPGRPTEQTVIVRPSAAIELEWLLHSAVREEFRADHPALHALFDEDRPDLLGVVAATWAGEDPAGVEPGSGEPAGGERGLVAFTELVLVAHHGGLLFEADASVLLDALPDLCASVPTGPEDWPLVAETDLDRRIALHRLTRLRRSAEVRRRFVDVVRRVWEAASASWEREGRPAVAEAVTAKEAMLSKGASWRDLVKGSPHFGENAERVVAALPPGGEIAVVPAYFAHVGLLYDLPGCVLLGIRAEEPGPAARERSEGLARRLRAISDPTRLAIVDSLRARPLTVTELAQRFGVAQPTISNHVKLLRDAGLVAEVRDGTRRNLVVDRDVGRMLVDDVARVLDAAPPQGAVPPPAPGEPQ
ncbi:MAG TPA: metalloregulator ArsR/SmtB family transcription factor [Acidimicrobiales bacterium]|nr:metalloregulator ArsR/SmtB family transcription factor [Acidimicrobiales bacterium]